MSRERDVRSPSDEERDMDEGTEGRKIFVGGLLLEVTESDLYKAFEKYGVVRAQIQYDSYSRRSRGFGFVIFGDERSCQKAVDEMEGKEIRGKRVSVKVAIPPEEIKPPPRRGGRFGGRGFGRGRFSGYGRGGYDPRYERGPPRYPEYERGYRGYERGYGRNNYGYDRYQAPPISYEDPYAGYQGGYEMGGGGGGGGAGYYDRYDPRSEQQYYPPKTSREPKGGSFPEGYRGENGYEDRYKGAPGGSSGPERSYRDRGYSTRSRPYDRPSKR